MVQAKLWQSDETDTHFIIGHSAFNEPNDHPNRDVPYGRNFSTCKYEENELLRMVGFFDKLCSYCKSTIPDVDDYKCEEKFCVDSRKTKLMYHRTVLKHHPALMQLLENQDPYLYHVRLYNWILAVAKNLELRPFNLTFLYGFRKRLATREEANEFADGKIITHNIRSLKAYFGVLSFYDDLDEFYSNIMNQKPISTTIQLYIYQLLTDIDWARYRRARAKQLRFFKNRIPTPQHPRKALDPKTETWKFLPHHPHAYKYQRHTCQRITVTDSTEKPEEYFINEYNEYF